MIEHSRRLSAGGGIDVVLIVRPWIRRLRPAGLRVHMYTEVTVACQAGRTERNVVRPFSSSDSMFAEEPTGTATSS